MIENHLHFHIKLASREGYLKFIKAITAAIVMAITKVNKFKALTKKFWDARPFTRIVFGEKDRKTMKRYIEINQLEGLGHNRHQAIFIIENYSDQY